MSWARVHRTRTLAGGAVVVALAAGAGGVVFALQRGDGAEAPTKGEAIHRADAKRAHTEDRAVDATDPAVAGASDQAVTVDELEVGDCVIDLLYPDAIVVPCNTAHQEIVAALVAPEGPYPGAELLVETFGPECEDRAADYISGESVSEEELFVVPEVPYDEVEWDVYGRTIVCATSPNLAESARGSGT